MADQKTREVMVSMRRGGVLFLAGTDTGQPWRFAGFSLHDDLVEMSNAGLEPMDVLQSATRNPARYFGRERELGTVEKGKLADLVLLDANPLQQIANTRKINAVVVNGRLLDRTMLDEMLNKLIATNTN
jgi:imidazolonepropionase-like amidohydrolase